MDPTHTQNVEPAGEREVFAAKPARRVPLLVWVVLLIGVWSAVMIFRWELRAQWWAFQVPRAQTPAERDYYVTRLASIRDKSLDVVPALLKNSRPEIREAGVHVLRFCKNERAAEYLMGQLKDPDAEVAMLVATALAWRDGASRYVPALCEQLNAGKDDPSSWGIVVAIGRIGGPQAEQRLLEAATSSSPPDIRAQAIDSLGMLGCKRAAPLIREAMSDHRPLQTLPQSQLSARRAISAMGSQLAAKGADPKQALASFDNEATVAGVAAHWSHLLGAASTQPASSAPSEQQQHVLDRIRQQWSAEQAASSRTSP